MQSFLSRTLLILVTLVMIFSGVNCVFSMEPDVIKNVIKLKTYESRPDGSFVFKNYGSAIAIGKSRILTNAHVILDSNGIPTGYYEVCFSVDFEKVPVCREIAQLVAYDIVADLAILELPHTDSLVPFTLASSKIALGSYVSMYGYPAIGGETITRTEWKIAGYEQSMYKIDGSIDHGNSWGGAFNNSGELVGIPTAVAADNASIGYMIPIQRIQSFLAKKTNNYEPYYPTTDRLFSHFLQKNQSYTSNKLFLVWNALNIKTSRPYGFVLKSSMISHDNTTANWIFSDSYDRVKINISCTDDAGKVLGWQVRKDGFKKEQELSPNWHMKLLDDSKYLLISASSKWYDPTITLYYKDYDACFWEVTYLDEKMDARSVAKALNFLKKWVSFHDTYTLKNTHTNHYFQIPHLEKDTRIIRSIDQLGAESVLIGIEVETWSWANAVLDSKEYETLWDLGAAFDIDFDVTKTWKDYIALGVKSWLNLSNIHVLNLSSWQRWILYTRFDPDKNLTNIVFEYTYITDNGRYAYWTWSSMIPGEFQMDTSRIQHIFTSLVYPGKSILQD